MFTERIPSTLRFLILTWFLLVLPFGFFIFRSRPDHSAPHGSLGRILWGSKWLFLFQSACASERAIDLNHFYLTKPWPRELEFNYKFVGVLPDNTTNPPNLALPDNLENWTQHPNYEDLRWQLRPMAGLFYAFNYTLHETDALWLFRSDDDILINFELLPRYIREMERMHDPLTEFVMRGDCIRNGATYPQGGAGVLFSRHAIERLIPMSHYSVWSTSADDPDQRLGRVVEAMGIDPGICSSSAFLGQPLDLPDLERVRSGNFAGLSQCPERVRTFSRCRGFVTPITQYVFFHIGAVENYTDIPWGFHF
jgi:hypothetical protein